MLRILLAALAAVIALAVLAGIDTGDLAEVRVLALALLLLVGAVVAP